MNDTQALIRAYDAIKPDAAERETFNEEIYVQPMPTFGAGVNFAIIFAIVGAAVVGVGIWEALIYVAHAIYMAAR